MGVNKKMKEIGFASEVELQEDSSYFVLFVCFVQFVDSFLGSKRTIHEFHETHEVTRNVLNSTFEAKPALRSEFFAKLILMPIRRALFV